MDGYQGTPEELLARLRAIVRAEYLPEWLDRPNPAFRDRRTQGTV